ncbi:sulfatase [Lentisphaera profundi]|uniref:Sulfatase n=1 Tax=Lentisphaera profundi TaxID=1658616 RepID=A0ABY7W1M7_9BACT|nr:sulfatase [Lentisphaera profundi]WDE98173.1 sulfatase [Lentisphaera profundi]
MMKYINICVLLFGAVLATQAEEKPNIIYINADDYGIMDSGFMGRKEYVTPNLDKLASRGMVFTNAYAPAANCAPSRACILSGQYATRHGVYTVGESDRGKASDRKIIPTKNTLSLQPDNLTLLGAFQQAGYKTGNFGKWHVGEDPKAQGCDVNVGGSHAGGTGKYFAPYKLKNIEQGPKGEHLPKRLTDEAIKFIEANKSENFFVYLAYYQVHTPIQPRMDLVAKYNDVPGIQPKYAALIEGMDIYIGELMDYLDKSGLSENTIILFSSDNGGINKISDQAPYRAGKGSYYEGGTRVPMIVSWPAKVKAGSRSDVPVIGLDFYPTLLDAATVSVPQDKILDGKSILPILTQESGIEKRNLFWHFPIYLQAYSVDNDEGRDPLFRTRPGSTMLSGKWKLHEYFEDGSFELYNLEDDKGERTNLAESMPEKLAELKKLLYAWRAEMNAPVPTAKNPQFGKKQSDSKSKKGKKNKKKKASDKK